MLGATLGVLSLLCVLGTGVAWFKRMKAVAIPENRIGFLSAMTAGLVLGVIAFAQGPGWIGGLPAGLAVLLGGLFCFMFAISQQKGGPGKLRIGDPLPAFSAPDDNGEIFSIASLSGRPFLLKFFRGHW